MMKSGNKLQVLLAGILLLSASLQASASLYEIICVECQLTEASYTLQDSSTVFDSGPIIFPSLNGDFEFDVLGQIATAYNSSFFYNPGDYQFGSASMTVGSGQLGMFFLVDWNDNISVEIVNVFDLSYLGSDMILTPTDVDGNGVVGYAIPEGPYPGVDLALNFTVTTPIPAAFWLFASGLLGLLHIAKRKEA